MLLYNLVLFIIYIITIWLLDRLKYTYKDYKGYWPEFIYYSFGLITVFSISFFIFYNFILFIFLGRLFTNNDIDTFVSVYLLLLARSIGKFSPIFNHYSRWTYLRHLFDLAPGFIKSGIIGETYIKGDPESEMAFIRALTPLIHSLMALTDDKSLQSYIWFMFYLTISIIIFPIRIVLLLYFIVYWAYRFLLMFLFQHNDVLQIDVHYYYPDLCPAEELLENKNGEWDRFIEESDNKSLFQMILDLFKATVRYKTYILGYNAIYGLLLSGRKRIPAPTKFLLLCLIILVYLFRAVVGLPFSIVYESALFATGMSTQWWILRPFWECMGNGFVSGQNNILEPLIPSTDRKIYYDSNGKLVLNPVKRPVLELSLKATKLMYPLIQKHSSFHTDVTTYSEYNTDLISINTIQNPQRNHAAILSYNIEKETASAITLSSKKSSLDFPLCIKTPEGSKSDISYVSKVNVIGLKDIIKSKKLTNLNSNSLLMQAKWLRRCLPALLYDLRFEDSFLLKNYNESKIFIGGDFTNLEREMGGSFYSIVSLIDNNKDLVNSIECASNDLYDADNTITKENYSRFLMAVYCLADSKYNFAEVENLTNNVFSKVNTSDNRLYYDPMFEKVANNFKS